MGAPPRSSGKGPYGVAGEPGCHAAGPTPVREDHTGPIPRSSRRAVLRSRRSGHRGAAGGADDRARAAARTDRHRRGAACPRPLHGAPRARRPAADARPLPAARERAPELVRGSSESLAGRGPFVEMSGFTLDEVGHEARRRLWLRGGYPRSFLARAEARSVAGSPGLRPDVPRARRTALGVSVPPRSLRRLWTMLAHYHGQILECLRDRPVAGRIAHDDPAACRHPRRRARRPAAPAVVREYRQARGAIAQALRARCRPSAHAARHRDLRAVESNPRLGASWEGFVLEQVLAMTGERTAILLGDAVGRRARLAGHARRSPRRGRGQVCGCAAPDEVDARGDARPPAVASARGLSGERAVRTRRTHRSPRPRGRAGGASRTRRTHGATGTTRDL